MEDAATSSRPPPVTVDNLPDHCPVPSPLPESDRRKHLRQQMAECMSSIVFHMGNTGTGSYSDQQFLDTAVAVEKKAFDKLAKESANWELRRGTMARYAQLAAGYLISAASDLLGDVVPLHVVAPMFEARVSNGLPPSERNSISLHGSATAAFSNLAPLRTRSSKITPVKEPGRTSIKPLVHGWLEPGTRVLPYVLLRDEVVIIGRGKEAYESSHFRSPGLNASNSRVQIPGSRTIQLRPPPDGRFVEVADGRVSRIHTVLQVSEDHGFGKRSLYLEDWSTNGTYVNGKKVGQEGGKVLLKDGDRISLVLSVAPLVEQFFVFHSGDPSALDADGTWDWISQAVPITPRRRSLRQSSISVPSPKDRALALQSVWQSTSRYNTKEWTTLDDLQCQICLSVLTQCVALVPCGHNFCAACLSQHFGNLLQGGLPLTCPLRCAAPERVVINQAVRALVGNHEPLETPHTAASSGVNAVAGDDVGFQSVTSSPAAPNYNQNRRETATKTSPPLQDEEDNDGMDMNPLCPLHDYMLPMEAASLKVKQVEFSLDQLRHGLDPDKQMTALEALARLSWSDDDVREEVARGHGIEAVVATIRRHPDKEGIQCNGCLALMSLVRGEGEVCQANQWRIAKAGGVEAIVDAMDSFSDQAMVQLSALLCMIPLALENPMMQAHVSSLALPAVCNAMRKHPKEAEVQAKAMVVMGVLAQGEDSVHDAIRYRQLSAKAPVLIADCMKAFGSSNDEVLWAALFSLAVMVREGGQPFDPACRAAARAGLHKLVVTSLNSYRSNLESSGHEDLEGDTILKAGSYLLEVLGPVQETMKSEMYKFAAVASAAAVVAVALPTAVFLGYRLGRRS